MALQYRTIRIQKRKVKEYIVCHKSVISVFFVGSGDCLKFVISRTASVKFSNVAAKPRFTTRPRPVESARESGIVEFTCVASGHPYPDYSWWKDNRIVNSDGRVTVSNRGQGPNSTEEKKMLEF